MLRKSRTFLFGILFTLAGCTSTPTQEFKPQKYSSLIRLQEDGRFYCSAFVISDRLAVTAAHCVVMGSGLFTMASKTVDVANSLGDKVRVAKVVGYNRRIDYALLKGDFRNFRKTVPDFSSAVYKAEGVKACGYPQGSKAVRCSNLKVTGTRFFQIKAKGELVFGGHSGGPVIDKSTGKVIGVISAVDRSGVLFAPIQMLKASFNIRED